MILACRKNNADGIGVGFKLINLVSVSTEYKNKKENHIEVITKQV